VHNFKVFFYSKRRFYVEFITFYMTLILLLFLSEVIGQ